jgi:uncharacterized membrane protein YfcA
MSVLTIAGLAAAGVGVGVLSALFGVGGGVIMVPIIALVLDRSQQLAEGTSLLVIIPTALVGVRAHAKRGYVSFRHAAWLAVGGIGGSFLGARLAIALDADVLQKIFGVFLVAAGARLVVQGRRARSA